MLFYALLTAASVALVAAHPDLPNAHSRQLTRKHAGDTHAPALKRDGGSGVRITNYDVSTGEVACGGFHSNSDYVVALSAQNWDNGAHCGEQIYITYQGMSAVATIVDECMGCPSEALDLTLGLFGHFVGGQQNDDNVGVFYADWVPGTGPAAPPAPTTTTHKTTSTPQWTPPPTTSTTPTSTWTPPTTTTHSTTSSTTTTSSSSSSSSPTPSTTSTSSSSSSSSSSSKSSSSAKPSSSSSAVHSSASASIKSSASAPAATPTGAQNLKDFSESMLGLLGLVVQAPGL